MDPEADPLNKLIFLIASSVVILLSVVVFSVTLEYRSKTAEINMKRDVGMAFARSIVDAANIICGDAPQDPDGKR